MTQIDLSGYTDRIQVDMTTRKIADSFGNGTQYDHKATRKVFEVDRYLNGVDLAEKLASIHWACGDNGGVYPVTEWDTQSVESKILIKWELLAEYTQGAVLTYAIHFYDLDGEEYGYHASTRIVRTVLPPTLVMTDHSNKTEDPSAVERLAGKLEEVEKSIVQSDYEENDPTSRNYIKNRPFYEDAVFQCELTPDMDVSQMETIRTDVGLPYVYISDTVIPEGTYAPAAVITGTDGEEQKDVRSPIQLEYNEDGVSYFGGIFILVNRDTEINGISAKKGIYVISPTAFTPVASGNLTAVLKIEIIKDIDRPFLSNVYDELDEKMGKNDPTGTGTFSMNDSKATGECSFTEGTGNIASGYSSHAEGYCTKASKGYSHAEGYGTTASGECSHAEGYYTTASGYSSHAEGAHAKPSGEYSHAEGYGTTASGKRSHSEGYYTIASGDCSHVMGKYNVEDTKNKYAFIIGGGSGTSNSKRKNIHAVDWNGNSYSGGTLYVNANANGENGSEVATKEYVEQNMSMRLDFYIGNYGYIYYTGTTDSFATILANPQRYPTATFGQPDKTIKFDGLLTLSEVGSDYIIYDRTYVENNEVKRDYVKFKSNNNDANKTTYGTETIGYLNAQADWDEQNEEAQGYIKNKPSLEPIVVVYTHTYNDVNFTLCGVKPSEVTYSEMCELLNENAPFLINVNHKPVLYWDFEQNQSTGKYTFTYYSVGSDAGEIKLMGSSVSGIPFKDESTNTSTNTSTSTSTSTST